MYIRDMKLIASNNISPLPFYDSIDKQNHRKDYAFGQIFPLITYRNMLLPFQVCVFLPTASTIERVRLYDCQKRECIDITSNMMSNGLEIKSFKNFQLIKYPGTLPIAKIKSEGLFYLIIDIDIGFNGSPGPRPSIPGPPGSRPSIPERHTIKSIYSDVFSVTNSVSDYLLMEYRSPYNFEIKNGIVDFSDNFSFKCYLNTQIGKPEYDFEEEATERMGYTFIESQVSKKIYKFTFLAPEYLCDALRIVRLCETKQITSKSQTYDLSTFSMEPKWEDQGDLAAVECEFETDTVIANIGGFTPEHSSPEYDGGDYNEDYNEDYKRESEISN